jgi:hypothetical protein
LRTAICSPSTTTAGERRAIDTVKAEAKSHTVA